MRIDINSATWVAIEEYANNRLGELRGRLEGINLNWEETQMVRAQMKELRVLLSQAEPTPAEYVAIDIETGEIV